MAAQKSIIKKTLEVGSSTIISRVLGLIREVLTVRFLGAGAVADAFVTAFKIPNSLRKIFAEGALSAALVPTLVNILSQEKNKQKVNSLVVLVFLLFESVVLGLCLLTMVYARSIIEFVAPGFSGEQIEYAVPFLQILMPFILFVSSSAIFAAALQAVDHFFVPAFGPVVLNIIFIISLGICLLYGLSPLVFCAGVLVAGFVQLVFHFIAYRKLGFSFAALDSGTWQSGKKVLVKFLPCLFSMSVAELSLFIDTSFASLLPEGSVALVYFANRFMGIPLGVFAVAFSTILLPYFSRVKVQEPEKLGFYLVEAIKLVWWVTIPATIIMGFFSHDIFVTIFLSKKFSLAQAGQASTILIIFLAGLFFFSINKVLLSVYYALHNTSIPAITAVIATVANIVLNYIFMGYWQAAGLALATVISSVIQTILFVWILVRWFNFKLHLEELGAFIFAYAVQLLLLLGIFGLLYYSIYRGMLFLPETMQYILLKTIGLWFWVGPLILLFAVGLLKTRRLFKVKVHFLDNR